MLAAPQLAGSDVLGLLELELQVLDEVEGLLAEGEQAGTLSHGEIAMARTVLDVDQSTLEGLEGSLEKREIGLLQFRGLDLARTGAGRTAGYQNPREQRPEQRHGGT